MIKEFLKKGVEPLLVRLQKTQFVNIHNFLKEKGLYFPTEKQEIEWVRRNLKPEICLKIGPNYLVDKSEVEKVFEIYLEQKVLIHKEQIERGKRLKRKSVKLY